MKRELKVTGISPLKCCTQRGYRTIPYEEGTESLKGVSIVSILFTDTEPFPMKRELKDHL